MKDHFENEEIELDKYMKNIDKEVIPVPDALESRIRQRMAKQKRKNPYGRNIAAACIALLLLFVGGVKFNPAFAVYAASIPVLKTAVEWLVGDKGITNAQEKGYKGMADIHIVEGGYTLHLSNIVMDEDRIYLTAALSGNKIINPYVAHDSSAPPKDSHISEPSKSMIDNTNLSLSFADFENSGAMSSSIGGDDVPADTMAMTIEKIFKSGELQKFLNTSPGALKLIAEIREGSNVLYTFKPITLPINQSNFMPSKTYTSNEVRTYDHTNLTLKQLTISPTRMRVDFDFDMEDGYTFAEFDNPYLKDDRGNVYKPEGLVSMSYDPKERSIYFVPSVYFDKMPKHLYFCYDGIRIASEEGRKFKLALNDIYPKNIEYMGEIVTIKEFSWQERSGLTIGFTVSDAKQLKIQNLTTTDYHDVTGWTTSDSISYTFLEKIKKQDVYDMQFEFAGYLLSDKAAWKIPLK